MAETRASIYTLCTVSACRPDNRKITESRKDYATIECMTSVNFIFWFLHVSSKMHLTDKWISATVNRPRRIFLRPFAHVHHDFANTCSTHCAKIVTIKTNIRKNHPLRRLRQHIRTTCIQQDSIGFQKTISRESFDS